MKYDIIWVSELALNLKQNGLSNLQLYCYNSKLYNDFVNKKVDLNFDGFKYLKEMQEQNISIEECNKAILRIAPKINMEKIENIFNDIPSKYENLPVISEIQKKYCLKSLKYKYGNILMPVYNKLSNR